MDEVLKVFGAVALAIIILGMPVLCVLSFIFSWPVFVIYLLSILASFDLIIVTAIVHDSADLFDWKENNMTLTEAIDIATAFNMIIEAAKRFDKLSQYSTKHTFADVLNLAMKEEK